MKLHTLLVAPTLLLTAALAVATPASASDTFPAPSDEVNSIIVQEVTTGKILSEWVPAQWDSIVEMEAGTGRIQQITECDPWQDASTPEACVGQKVGPALIAPAKLATLLGLN